MAYGTPSFATTTPTGAAGMNEIVGILKEIYDDQTIQVMTYTDNPFLAMVQKKTDFGGKLYPLPVIVDASTGRSSNFGNAQQNQSPATIKEFILTRASDYSVAQVTHEAMLAAQTDRMSFVREVKLAVDQAFQVCVNSLASACFRSGTGSIGQVSGSVSTGVITLTDPNSIVQFMVGQVLQANATDGGATPRAALGYVIAMNRAQGQLTVSATQNGAAGTPTGWSANDYLLVQGDNNAKVTGIAGWLNANNVTGGDSFFSVNRSSDVTRLAGVYYDGSSQSIEESLVDSSTLLAREGGKPDVAIVPYSSYSALEKSLGARAVYTDWEGPANIMFRGIEINGANSRIKVFPDRNAQAATAWLLTMKTWYLLSLGEAPQIFDYNDNLQWLRMSAYDAAELRKHDAQYKSSLIDLEARRGDRAQAKAA